MDRVFIISPLVGSVIGYFTNWLAIKMLFRPLTKKEFLGIKIPFTPGVIPRRRGKLAESIGETVGSRLLTADAFKKILQGEEMQDKVKKFIRDKLKLLEKEERSLKEIIEQVLKKKQEREELVEEVEELIAKLVKDLLAAKRINVFVKDFFNKLDQKKIKEYFASQNYKQFKDHLLTKLDRPTIKRVIFSLSKTVVVKAEESEKKLKDIVPDSITDKIKVWIAAQEPKLTDQIEEFLTSKEIKNRINKKLDNFLGSGSLLGMLGGVKNSILNKFLDLLVDFLKEPESKEEIRKQLINFLDTLLETRLSELAGEIEEEDLEKAGGEIADYLLAGGKIEALIELVENKIINKIETGDLRRETEDLLEELLVDSNFITVQTENFLLSWLQKLSCQPLSSYFVNLSSEKLAKIETGLINVIEYIMERELGEVLATLNFKKMVKEKVNSFDVLEVEGLLLDVIEAELNAITWFGALLGFIMGLITPVISVVTG